MTVQAYEPVLIGKGAFSKVYRVQDEEGSFYACKVTDAGAEAEGKKRAKGAVVGGTIRTMAEHEAEVMRRLPHHPIFPQYYESRQEGSCTYLVMEYCPGQSLEHILSQRGGLNPWQTGQIAVVLADGLRCMHEGSPSLIYRDLKAENIMIAPDGSVKLVDFGCVCEAGRTKSLAGTHGSSAPEQFDREALAFEESDVYALGKLMLRMLGEEPERGLRGRLFPDAETRERRRLMRIAYMATRTGRRDRIPDMRHFLMALAGEEKEADFSYAQKFESV